MNWLLNLLINYWFKKVPIIICYSALSSLFSLGIGKPITVEISVYSDSRPASKPAGYTDPVMEVAPRPKNCQGGT